MDGATIGIIATAAVGIVGIGAQVVSGQLDRKSRAALAVGERAYRRRLDAYTAAAAFLYELRDATTTRGRRPPPTPNQAEWAQIVSRLRLAGPDEVADAFEAVPPLIPPEQEARNDVVESLDIHTDHRTGYSEEKYGPETPRLVKVHDEARGALLDAIHKAETLMRDELAKQ